MRVNDLLGRLERVKARGTGRWSARCPAHADSNPSLSICEAGAKILLRCFSGCETLQIVAALGLEMCDLFMDSPTSHGQRPPPKPVRIDRVALAFRYELAALDRRLRAERVMKATTNFSIDELEDMQLDRLMRVVARTHADLEQAELFEGVADDLRWKSFKEAERTVHHAA